MKIANNEDRINAACKVLQIIKDSKQSVSALKINAVADLIRNAKTTKLDLDAAIVKFQSIYKPYLMNTRDPNVENNDLLIASPHDSDELVIRRTNKDGSKSEYLISLEQLVLFITKSCCNGKW